MPVYRVYGSVYVVGGEGITDSMDSNVYLVVGERNSILIDAGAGRSWHEIVRNILELGVEPTGIRRIAVTHCHVNNAGGSEKMRRLTGGMVAAHEPDAGALRRGDPQATLAAEYGVYFEPVIVGLSIRRGEVVEHLGDMEVTYVHTPGHTPGSMSIKVQAGRGRGALFVGDVFGPLSERWGSDEGEWRHSLEKLEDLDYDTLCSSTGCVDARRGRRFVEEALETGPVWV